MREGDGELSARFATAYEAGIITKGEWIKANKCRIYLKVLTVGDIASGDGRTIDGGVYKGHYDATRARRMDWPVQGRPKRTD